MAAGKSCALQRVLSSTPTPETWKTTHGLIADGEDVAWRGDSNETLLHLVPSCAQETSYVDYLLPVVYQLASNCHVDNINCTNFTDMRTFG